MEGRSRARSELGELFGLAGPLALAYAGNNLLGFVDTAMVGRLGAAALGAVSMGNSVFFSVCLFGMGLVNGMDPLVAQAVGAGEHARAREILAGGVRLALAISLPLIALIVAFSFVLEPIGVARDASVLTRSFVVARLANAVPFFVATAMRSHLQATSRTRPIILSVVVANVMNFVFDALFIYGDRALLAIGLPAVGLPAMGVFGAGLASSVASLISLAPLVLALRDDLSWRAVLFGRDRELTRKILRLGRPIGVQILAEVGLFTATGLSAGVLGVLPIAAHNIALSLASFTFNVALGVSAATAVLVGRAVGRDDTPAARRAGFLGLVVASTFMAGAALSFVVVPVPLIHVLTDKEDVVLAALPLVHIAALFQLSDGAQVTMAAALRGAGDTRYPQIVTLIGYPLVGFPIVLVFGFVLHLGVSGLWWGLVAALTFVAALLMHRFHILSKTRIARA